MTSSIAKIAETLQQGMATTETLTSDMNKNDMRATGLVTSPKRREEDANRTDLTIDLTTDQITDMDLQEVA